MMTELDNTKCDDIKIVVFADDFSATWKLKSFFQWWTVLVEIGPKFGYCPEPTKLFITKFETHALGKELFNNTKLKIKYSSKKYLRSVIGTARF